MCVKKIVSKVVGVDKYLENSRVPPKFLCSKGLGKRYFLSHVDNWIDSGTIPFKDYELSIPRQYQKLLIKSEGVVQRQTVYTYVTTYEIVHGRKSIVDTSQTKRYYYKVFPNLYGKYTSKLYQLRQKFLYSVRDKIYNHVEKEFNIAVDSEEHKFLKECIDNDIVKFRDFVFGLSCLAVIRDKISRCIDRICSKVVYLDMPKEIKKLRLPDIPKGISDIAFTVNEKISNGVFGQRNRIDLDIRNEGVLVGC